MKREPTYRQPVQFSSDIECDQSCGPRWSRHCGALGCARWTGDPSIAVAPSMAPAMAYVGGDTDVTGGCLRSAFLTPFRRRVNACSKLSTRVDFAVFNALICPPGRKAADGKPATPHGERLSPRAGLRKGSWHHADIEISNTIAESSLSLIASR